MSVRQELGPRVSEDIRKNYAARLAKRFSPQRSNVSSRTNFRHRLESHLNDVSSGHAWRSLVVHQELRAQHLDNRRSLAEFDPESLRLYVGLMSGMSYSHQARLASTVYNMNRDLGVLIDAGRQLAALKVATVDRYA